MEELPNELLLHIGRYLKNKDILSFYSINKRFFNLRYDSSLELQIDADNINIKYIKQTLIFIKTSKSFNNTLKLNPVKLWINPTEERNNPIISNKIKPNDLKSVKYLYVINSIISDVSMFKNIHELLLYSCNYITDVSILKNVYNLYLVNCVNIKDVSSLSNCHNLVLSGCVNITDVSTLGSINNLDLSHCRNISDFSNLGNVKILNLSNTNIKTCTGLGNNYILNLSNCDKLTDVSNLTKVHNLDISNCRNISDYSMLIEKIKYLKLK